MTRIPQGPLIKKNPKLMDFLFNISPTGLSRVLMGKPQLPWPSLLSNKRTGSRGISDEDFVDKVLRGSRPGAFTPWINFYVYSPSMCEQMRFQRETFANATFPVYMLQGAQDKGQPMYLFDGTAALELDVPEVPGEGEGGLASSAGENTDAAAAWGKGKGATRAEGKCIPQTTYSPDGTTPIGPTAVDFFPQR